MHDYMPSKKVTGKRVYITLFSFFILSACSPSTRKWQYDRIQGSSPHFESYQLKLPSENAFSGIEFEILHSRKGQFAYLNILGSKLMAEDQGLVTLTIQTDNTSQDFKAYLLEGGHRILLDSSTSKYVIDRLENNQEIKISVQGLSVTIIPEGFSPHFKKLP